jgi:tRNA-dihydrouridine synthase B
MSDTLSFPPLRIGPFELAAPAVLAPLAGYTDLSFRRICRLMGAGYCSTEVTLDTSINLSPKLRLKLIQPAADDHPLAGQIMGCKAETMAIAAGHLLALGCDVVDLNFACPVRKVLRRKRGGHLMRDPDGAVATIRAVAAAVGGQAPITVKLRKSFDQDDADLSAFWQIAEAAFDAGAVAINVHARSVEARYSGPADWEFLARVKQHFGHKVIIGSGDVLSPHHAVDLLRLTGVDGVAFARGALGNPWIFRQFEQLLAGRQEAAPTLAEQRDVIARHYALCVEQYGSRGARMMHRFGIKYARCHPNPKLVRHAFIDSPAGVDVEGILNRYYGPSEAMPV